MRIFSDVTEQDLINIRKLAEQQKEQRALKIINRILKQTHDKKLAESLSPITKKLDEVKKSNQKRGDVIKENNTPQLAMENTHKALLIDNEEKKHPGVIYDASLEITLNNMKTNIGFFNVEERDNGGIIWNGFPVEKMGGNKLKINGKICNITTGSRKILTDPSSIRLKKLNDRDREKFDKILESLDFENRKAIHGEYKSSRYKQSKTNLKKNIIWKVRASK